MKDYLDKFDALTFRERVILALLFILLSFYIWYVFLYEPLVIQEKNLSSRVESLKNDNDELILKVYEVQARLKQDPNEKNKKQVALLKQELQKTRQDIIESTAYLVKPEDMPELLRQILLESEGLTLTTLNGLGRSNIITSDSEQKSEMSTLNADKEDRLTAYKHGLKISFSASFTDTLRFIQKLENLSSGFFWSSLNLQVGEYPVSSSEITLFTLSLDENWIEI